MNYDSEHFKDVTSAGRNLEANRNAEVQQLLRSRQVLNDRHNIERGRQPAHSAIFASSAILRAVLS
jgi:hypothetical protein